MIDFRGIIPKQKANGLFDFRIQIDGIYGWGGGYYSTEHYNLFKQFIRGLDMHLGDIFNDRISLHQSSESYGCDTLKNPLTHKYVYLHPMEFTGYLEENEIENLNNYINSYFADKEDIHSSISRTEQVVAMSDEEYENLIFDYSEEIIKRVQDYYDKLSPQRKEDFKKYGYREVAMDFARDCRISREGDHMGISSGDVDIRAVEHILKIAMKTGVLKE